MQRIDLYDRISCWEAWVNAGNCYTEDRETGIVKSVQFRSVQRIIVQRIKKQAATCPLCRDQIHGPDPVCWHCTKERVLEKIRQVGGRELKKKEWPAMVYRGIPIRIITPKARREGVSTLVQSLGVFLVNHYRDFTALTVAHTAPETRKIFRLAKRISQGGKLDDARGAMEIKGKPGSLYQCRTGMGKYVESGGGLQFAHISELGKFERGKGQAAGSSADTEAVTSLINSVALAPHTMVFIESTGQGPGGEFHDRVKSATHPESEWELIFLPWFADDEYISQPPKDFELKGYERQLKEEFSLTDPQIFWYRRKMISESAAEEGTVRAAIFRREYPSRLSDCFAGLEGRVYPMFDRSTHFCQELDLDYYANVNPADEQNDADIGLMRSVDVGWSGSHALVWLWIAYDQTKKPKLIINPMDKGCQSLMDELELYSWNPQTDEPNKDHDHGPDALRYAIVTRNLRGLVYVYRALYFWGTSNYAPESIARTIHQASGWTIPEGEDQEDITAYCPPDPKGGQISERYTMTVCDRSARGFLTIFNRWGFNMITQKKPDKNVKTRSEVKDGIAMVQALMAGRGWLVPPVVDIREEAIRTAAEAQGGRGTELGRMRGLTELEHEVLDQSAGINEYKDQDIKYFPWLPPPGSTL